MRHKTKKIILTARNPKELKIYPVFSDCNDHSERTYIKKNINNSLPIPPILCVQSEDGEQVVLGIRKWNAAKENRIKKIPVLAAGKGEVWAIIFEYVTEIRRYPYLVRYCFSLQFTTDKEELRKFVGLKKRYFEELLTIVKRILNSLITSYPELDSMETHERILYARENKLSTDLESLWLGKTTIQKMYAKYKRPKVYVKKNRSSSIP